MMMGMPPGFMPPGLGQANQLPMAQGMDPNMMQQWFQAQQMMMMQQQTAAASTTGVNATQAATPNNMMFPGGAMGMPVMTPVLVQIPQPPGSTAPPQTQMMFMPMYPGMMPPGMAQPTVVQQPKKDEGNSSK